jgi:antitoxin (DNA-binding transcriptional repressor) of toxin-antitoxin stability system
MIRSGSRLVDDAPDELAAVVARGEAGWGVALLHGGECVAFLTPAQAEAEAKRLRDLARLARRPGKLPERAK